MTDKIDKVTRSPKVLFVYLILALYGYCLNVVGPVVDYLKVELNLSYTASSVHTSAFALGIVIVGVFGGRIITRLSHNQSIGLGAMGLGLGGIILILGRTPALTIGGLFLMGLIGTLILATYPAVLDEAMGKFAPIGISEANTLASVLASLAPIIVGYFAARALTWRPAVLIVICLAFGMGFWLFFFAKTNVSGKPTGEDALENGILTARFWLLWVALVVAISIEFCTIYWGANFIQQVLLLPQAQATQMVSLFLIGMVVGRFFGSKLMLKFTARTLLVTSILLLTAGFGLFWSSLSTLALMVGLALMGLGVANLYPVILSLAMKSAGPLKKLAGSRSTLASGTAILLLPFVLGSMADLVGIRTAFLVVAILIVSLSGLLVYTSKRADSAPRGSETFTARD